MGILVAVEGIDGSGKSTQIRRLAELFGALGFDVVATKEPTDGVHGQTLRRSAVDGRLPIEEELALFLADRREHVDEVIAPALAAGALVLVDRYYFSTAAYQGARGVDPDAILAENEAFAPRPDLIAILDLPAEVGLARVRRRDVTEDAFEQLEDLRRCRTIFLRNQGPDVRVFDATGAPDDVTPALVEALLLGPFQARCGRSLRRWIPVHLADAAWRRGLAADLRGVTL